MALNGRRIIIIVGCGPGARECVTQQALDAVVEADVLVGAPRLLDLFPECCRAGYFAAAREILALESALHYAQQKGLFGFWCGFWAFITIASDRSLITATNALAFWRADAWAIRQ